MLLQSWAVNQPQGSKVRKWQFVGQDCKALPQRADGEGTCGEPDREFWNGPLRQRTPMENVKGKGRREQGKNVSAVVGQPDFLCRAYSYKPSASTITAKQKFLTSHEIEIHNMIFFVFGCFASLVLYSQEQFHGMECHLYVSLI